MITGSTPKGGQCRGGFVHGTTFIGRHFAHPTGLTEQAVFIVHKQPLATAAGVPILVGIAAYLRGDTGHGLTPAFGLPFARAVGFDADFILAGDLLEVSMIHAAQRMVAQVRVGLP